VKAHRADGTAPAATDVLPASAEPAQATAAEASPAATEPEGTPQGAAAGSTAATAAADTGPTPTVDPTVQALAANFEFPMLGDANAPLKIYEFSDYL
jgi:protein-disulfide isomerase